MEVVDDVGFRLRLDFSAQIMEVLRLDFSENLMFEICLSHKFKFFVLDFMVYIQFIH